MIALICKELSKYNKQILNFCGLTLMMMFLIFSYAGISFHEICFPLTVVLFIVDLYLYRKKQAFLFVDFYIFLYFLYLYFYFYKGSHMSIRTFYHKNQYFENTCFLFYIFYFSQFLVFKKDHNSKKDNSLVVYNRIYLKRYEKIIILSLALLLLVKTMTIGTDLIRNGFNYQAYIKNLESSSVVPMLFVVVLTVYAFSEKSKKSICFILSMFYLYFCISRGFRITAIPGILVLYMAFMEGRIKNKLFYLGIILSLMIVIISGEIKDRGSFNLSNFLSSNSNKGGLISSHHTDILYTVCCVFGVVENGMIDSYQRLTLGISFFLQSIILPSMFPDSLRFPLAVFVKAENGGGGLFLAGAYLFWGFAGTFAFCYLLNKFLLSSYKSKSIKRRFIAAVVLVFSCNWISYDFHTILRFPVYALIVLYFVKTIDWRLFFKNGKSTRCIND